MRSSRFAFGSGARCGGGARGVRVWRPTRSRGFRSGAVFSLARRCSSAAAGSAGVAFGRLASCGCGRRVCRGGASSVVEVDCSVGAVASSAAARRRSVVQVLRCSEAAGDGACSSAGFLRRNQGSGKRSLLRCARAQPRAVDADGRASRMVGKALAWPDPQGSSGRAVARTAPVRRLRRRAAACARRARIARRRCDSRAQAHGSTSTYRSRGLASGRLEVLEPGVRLFDQQELERFLMSGQAPCASPPSIGKSLGPGPDGPAARTRLEAAHGRLADRARAGVGDRALDRPAGDRDEVEQLARHGAEAEAGADDAEQLRRARSRSISWP